MPWACSGGSHVTPATLRLRNFARAAKPLVMGDLMSLAKPTSTCADSSFFLCEMHKIHVTLSSFFLKGREQTNVCALPNLWWRTDANQLCRENSWRASASSRLLLICEAVWNWGVETQKEARTCALPPFAARAQHRDKVTLYLYPPLVQASCNKGLALGVERGLHMRVEINTHVSAASVVRVLRAKRLFMLLFRFEPSDQHQ